MSGKEDELQDKYGLTQLACEATCFNIAELVDEGFAVTIEPALINVESGESGKQETKGFRVSVSIKGLECSIGMGCYLVDAMTEAFENTPEWQEC